MRTVHSTQRFIALLTLTSALAACSGGEEKAADTTTAAPPPPPAESFMLVANDGSWTVDITPQSIVWRRLRGDRVADSIVFDYKAPSINGAFYEFESLRMAEDTNRISISLAKSPCTGSGGQQYTHRAQVWITGKRAAEGGGCGNQK
jgi:uncharacterized membrane protein